MDMYRLNATFDIVGGFWPPASPNEVTAGTLSSQNGRLQLSVSPTFKRLDDDQVREALMAFGTTREWPEIDTLCGHTKSRRCTLLHLTASTGAGVTDCENRLEIAADRWRVSSAIMGLHLDSAESESLDGAAFYFTKIHNWLPSPWGVQMNNEGFIYTSPFKALTVFQFSSISLNAEVTCEVFAGGGDRMKKGARIKPVPRIKIIPSKPKSLDWFISIGPRLENFFSLFLGTSVALKSVQLFQGKDDGWFVKKMQKRREKVNLQAWVRLQGHEVAGALAEWLAVPEERRPVEITVLGMIRKSSLFVETEFLGLAQALEGFGRLRFEGGLIPKTNFKQGLVKLKKLLREMWGDSEITQRCTDSLGNANETSYSRLIGQTYDLLSVDFAMKFLGERAQFTRTVVQTRNYFTHLGIPKGKAVVDDGKELFLLNQRLHAFLRCAMLIELRIPEEALKEPISYQAARWR
jgi:hypothetical protein